MDARRGCCGDSFSRGRVFPPEFEASVAVGRAVPGRQEGHCGRLAAIGADALVPAWGRNQFRAS